MGKKKIQLLCMRKNKKSISERAQDEKSITAHAHEENQLLRMHMKKSITAHVLRLLINLASMNVRSCWKTQ